MGIINGFKEPRFKIYSKTGALVNTIDLPLCGSKGLVETYDIKKITHELIDWSTLQSIRGYIIHFTLHYDSFAEGETLLKLKQVIEYAQAGYRIELIPRRDFLWRKFDVFISSDSFELGLLGGYKNSKGHRFPVIEFTTCNLLGEIPWAITLTDVSAGTGLVTPMEGELQ